MEQDKRPDQRGQYLNPEAFGLPASRGVNALSKTAKKALSRRPGNKLVILSEVER